MKKIFLTILFLFYCAYPFQGHAERAEFVSGFEDLPLMPGLQEHDDTGVSFDTPGGRIIEAYAETSKLTAKDIFSFYAKTLPQLGWRRTSERKKGVSHEKYERDGEILDISVEDGSPVIVRFELTTDGQP